GIVQPPVIAVVTEQQCAEVRAAPTGFAPSDDNEFLAVQALRLQPEAAIAGDIRPVNTFRDDAFDAQPTRLSAEARAFADNMVADPQPADRAREQRLQPLLALDEWQCGRIPSVQKE